MVVVKHVYKECNQVANFMAKKGQALAKDIHIFDNNVPLDC
ncbi:uncharacterized protein G2W53_015889 [Senna tora]|uniref:Uncharacterized protein n=1 Tax=Senna tora TaxID=362788 RepID=A0A834WW25_9FABA|nr:uncharacterized protein G2W53_015889 [Senna tora]